MSRYVDMIKKIAEEMDSVYGNIAYIVLSDSHEKISEDEIRGLYNDIKKLNNKLKELRSFL